MIRLVAPAALALVACSPDAGNTPAPANDQAAAPEVAFSPAPDVTPAPGDLETFRDWTVGCDNGLSCKMASLGPEMGDAPTATMSVGRDGGPAGGYRIDIEGEGTDAAAIVIDGQRVAAGDDVAGADAARVVAAMVNGRSLTLTNGSTTVATISLAGASAALRWIDERQGRVGTVTAAVAKGAAPATSVPAPPAVPVIRALAIGGAAAAPSAAQVAAMRTQGGCDTEGFAAESAPEAHALAGGGTLVVLPCGAGAYNMIASLFVVRDGTVEPARVDAPSGFGENAEPAAVPQVVNAEVDDGRLVSYAKGRGIGDCGVGQKFAWDGTRLRLIEQAQMGECRGNTDTIRTWRADVAR